MYRWLTRKFEKMEKNKVELITTIGLTATKLCLVLQIAILLSLISKRFI